MACDTPHSVCVCVCVCTCVCTCVCVHVHTHTHTHKHTHNMCLHIILSCAPAAGPAAVAAASLVHGPCVSTHAPACTHIHVKRQRSSVTGTCAWRRWRRVRCVGVARGTCTGAARTALHASGRRRGRGVRTYTVTDSGGLPLFCFGPRTHAHTHAHGRAHGLPRLWLGPQLAVQYHSSQGIPINQHQHLGKLATLGNTAEQLQLQLYNTVRVARGTLHSVARPSSAPAPTGRGPRR